MQKQKWLDTAIIIFFWLLVNFNLYSKNGIKIVADSERYLEYGRGLMSGFYIDSFNFWYIGYSAFIALCGGDIFTIIIAQYTLSLLAAFALYHAALILWETRRTAEFIAILFLCFRDIHQWNSYILTESIYTSFICFSVYGLALIYRGERRWYFLLLIAFVILFTSFIKPTGIALFGALMIVLILQLENLSLRISCVVVLSIASWFLLNKMLSNYLVIESYRKGEVIYAGIFVDTPADIYDPPASDPPIIRILSFIFHHPIYWTKLFLYKAYYLLMHTRPFWSKVHNTVSIVYLLIAYVSFIAGIRSKTISRDVVIFTLTFLSIHILSVGMTSDDWDGRFLIPMLPVIFIFSGHGLTTWRYRNRTE